MSGEKVFLGDGLYASSDGYGVWLTAEDGISVLQKVYLEPSTYTALARYVENLVRQAGQ